MPDRPLISVVVPVWNSPAFIRKCLRALDKQSLPKNEFEVLVVDNGSTDGTADAARAFPFARLLQEPAPGSYHARNLGLSEARGEYIAFTDADCIPARDWLEKALAAAHAHPEAGVIAGRIHLFRANSTGSKICEWYERLFAFRQDIGAAKGLCATANWVSRRDVLLAAGGFEARKSGADGELAHRIHSSGRRIVFAPDMVVHHPIRGTFEELARKRRRLTGGRWERTSGRLRTLRVLLYIFWDTLRRLRQAIFDSRIDFLMKAKLASIVVALSYVAVVELIHLAGNHEASRA